MALHARIVARGVGAAGNLVDRVAAEIAALGDVRAERAREILNRLNGEPLAAQSNLEKTS